ncbi:MAG TPA: CocE/NonD family hydrolase, partial [Mycobacteriales bacterium]|nr:CocE/NonD family hydrolase [Mycobacteriales bacterium]
ASRSADCQAHFAEHYRDDPNSRFWRVRDFVVRAKGSTVPVFMTTGYVDANTNIGGGAVDYFATLRGPKRLWIGWWDHVRGNDLAGDELAMGRARFFDEVMRFYDEHLKGIRPARRDPVVVAQTSTGTWTAEPTWPARDARGLTAPLLAGTYADDGRNRGSNDTAAGPGGAGPVVDSPTTGAGAWTFSPPLRRTARLAGIPSARVVLTTSAPRTNVVVNVYDVAPDGRATMVTRGAALSDGGAKLVALWPTDWTFRPGHRVGVLVSGANSEAYVHVPTRQQVSVESGAVTLPWLSTTRRPVTAGIGNPRLETFLESAPFEVDPSIVEERTEARFPLPS